MDERQTRTARQIEELARHWADTELRADTDAMRSLLADDYVGIGPRGFTLTKPEWIGRYESAALKNESAAWDDASVRVYGDAAIVVGRYTLQASYQGQPAGGRFRTTLVFVALNGEWKLAGLQFSQMVAV
jgi:ketosteroid isomerase-like protein